MADNVEPGYVDPDRETNYVEIEWDEENYNYVMEYAKAFCFGNFNVAVNRLVKRYMLHKGYDPVTGRRDAPADL